ncbi:MAG: disulfide bond formation protein B [Gammaproteobacteria bacterium]|nr:disulfide bond formation protein B [Gammaproteobacteria bacterium]
MMTIINKILHQPRLLNLTGFVICVAAMLFAVMYLQGVLYLNPCPLCIVDRVLISMMAGIFLLAAIHNPVSKIRLVYAGSNLLLVIAAFLVGARHVWLQHLPPDQVPECGAGLAFMLDVLPLWEVVTKVFTGSGECAEVQWQFLGLSIPEQTLILFSGLLVLVVYLLILKPEE